tara:strand:+ start:265 stop:477 length:213 start_codon:yes stop_codon:yes gene_type:complete
MKTLTKQHLDEFLSLANGLSPENLTCDGEATKKQVIQRRKTLMGRWRQLEKAVGRKVTEEDVWQEFFARR